MATDLKSWITNNIKWIISIIIIGISNYYVLANRIEINSINLDKKLDTEKAVVYIDERIEAKFDKELKHFFSNLDGEVLKANVTNLKEQVDRLEKLIEKLPKQ